MKKSTLFLGLFLAAVFAFAQVTTVTIYCDEGYQPYAYGEGTTAKGAYVDVIMTAASKLKGYKVEIVPVPWKRGLAMMESGEAFALMPTYKRVELRPWMNYELKVGEEKVVVLLNSKSGIPATSKWPDDFLGKSIALNAGYSTLDTWKTKVKVQDVKTNDIGIQMLQSGRVDAYVNDEVLIFSIVKDMKAKKAIPADTSFVVGPLISLEETFISLTNTGKAKYAYWDDFSKQMKASLDAMWKSGEIKKIFEKYTK